MDKLAETMRPAIIKILKGVDLGDIFDDDEVWYAFQEIVQQELDTRLCWVSFDAEGMEIYIGIGQGDVAREFRPEFIDPANYIKTLNPEQREDVESRISGIDSTIAQLQNMKAEYQRQLAL